MKILIDVAGFVNRGDQLMFRAIVQAVHKRLPNAELVLPTKLIEGCDFPLLCPDFDHFSELADCRRLGRRCKYAIKKAFSMVGLYKHSIVWPCQVDVVLHSPGFRYSDAFPLRRVRSFRNEVRYFRMFSKRGRKIFFLPQAFGPFDTDGAQQRILAIAPFADWIYARDATSFTYLNRFTPPPPLAKSPLRLTLPAGVPDVYQSGFR